MVNLLRIVFLEYGRVLWVLVVAAALCPFALAAVEASNSSLPHLKAQEGVFSCKSQEAGRIVADVCGDPLSRYMCRSKFPQNPGVLQV